MWLLTRNFGEDEITLLRESGFLKNFRLALFDAGGRPVPKSANARELEAAFARPSGYSSSSSSSISPGSMGPGYYPVYVNRWFDIQKAGTYSLVVVLLTPDALFRRHPRFPISNAAKIVITAGEKPDTAEVPSEVAPEATSQQTGVHPLIYTAIGALLTLALMTGVALFRKSTG